MYVNVLHFLKLDYFTHIPQKNNDVFMKCYIIKLGQLCEFSQFVLSFVYVK